MSVQVRDIKRRINSTRHIGKVTSALQQVASARLAKERRKVEALSRYTEEIAALLEGIVGAGQSLDHPLLRPSTGKGTCIVVIGSDRGLCGGYNSEVIDKLNEFAQSAERSQLTVVTIGAIPRRRAAKLHYNITASYPLPSPDKHEEFLDSIMKAITKGFIQGDFGTVKILYTHFISPLNKKPVVVDILPMTALNLTGVYTSLDPNDGTVFYNTAIMDPSATALINMLLPEVLRQTLDYTVRHGVCSEDAYRQESMSRASENAKEMMQDLTLKYSRLRQEDITTEMLEIAASGFAGAKS